MLLMATEAKYRFSLFLVAGGRIQEAIADGEENQKEKQREWHQLDPTEEKKSSSGPNRWWHRAQHIVDRVRIRRNEWQ